MMFGWIVAGALYLLGCVLMWHMLALSSSKPFRRSGNDDLIILVWFVAAFVLLTMAILEEKKDDTRN